MADTETPTTEQAMPTNVIAALARVEAEMGGVAKKTGAQRGRTESGVNYAYRGIDEIAAAAQSLLGKYGVVMVPTVVSRDTIEITVGGKPWTDTFVLIEWHIYGPGGVDDVITSRTEGWGRDNADKGINKAMTGAYKNLMLRMLCIGDPGDDTDGASHERDDHSQQYEPPPETPQERAEREAKERKATEVRELFAKVKAAAGTPTAESLKELAKQENKKLTEQALAEDDDWREMVRLLVEALGAEESTNPQLPVDGNPERPVEGSEGS